MAIKAIQSPPIRTQITVKEADLLKRKPMTPLSKDWEEWFRQVYLHLADLEARVTVLEP